MSPQGVQSPVGVPVEKQNGEDIKLKPSFKDASVESMLNAAKAGDLQKVVIPFLPIRLPSLQLIFLQIKEYHRRGVPLSSTDSTGQTVLHYAARYGHRDLVKYFISFAPISLINVKDHTL